MRNIFLIFALLLPFFVFTQDTIRGRVSNSSNLPLMYASIGYYGKNIGSLTDSSGKFTLRKIAGDSIKISSLGYKAKTIAVDKQTNFLNIQLEDDINILNEIFVETKKLKNRKKEIGHFNSRWYISYRNLLAEQLQEAVFIPNPEQIDGYIDEIRVRLAEFRDKGYNLRIRVLLRDTVKYEPSNDLLISDNIIKSKDLKKLTRLSIKDKKIRLPQEGIFISFEWLPEKIGLSGGGKVPYILGNLYGDKVYLFTNYKEKGWHASSSRSVISNAYHVIHVSMIISY